MIIIDLAILSFLLASFYVCYSRLINEQKTIHDFLFQGNSLPLSIISNIGSMSSMSMFIMGAGYVGYTFGYQAIYVDLFACVITFLFFLKLKIEYFTSPNIESYKFTSTVDIVREHSTIKISQFYLITILVLLATVFLSEIFLLRILLQNIIPINYENPIYITLFIIVICMMYVYKAGYEGILKTDLVQVVVFMILFICICIYAPSDHYLALRSREGFSFLAWSHGDGVVGRTLFQLILMTVFTVSYFICSEDFWVRTSITLKDNKISICSAALSCLLMTLLGIVATYFGATVKYKCDPILLHGASLENFTQLYFYIIEFANSGHPALRGAVAVAIVAASITTIDTSIITLAQLRLHFSGDPNNRRQNITDPRTFLTITLLALWGLSICYNKSNFAEFTTYGLNILFISMFVLVGTTFFKEKFERNISIYHLIFLLFMSYASLYLGNKFHDDIFINNIEYLTITNVVLYTVVIIQVFIKQTIITTSKT